MQCDVFVYKLTLCMQMNYKPNPQSSDSQQNNISVTFTIVSWLEYSSSLSQRDGHSHVYHCVARKKLPANIWELKGISCRPLGGEYRLICVYSGIVGAQQCRDVPDVLKETSKWKALLLYSQHFIFKFPFPFLFFRSLYSVSGSCSHRASSLHDRA